MSVDIMVLVRDIWDVVGPKELELVFDVEKHTHLSWVRQVVSVNICQIKDIYNKPEEHRRLIRYVKELEWEEFVRFIIYHEIGHWYLNHRFANSLKQMSLMDDEADTFAFNRIMDERLYND